MLDKKKNTPQLDQVLLLLKEFVKAHFPKASYATLLIRLDEGMPSVTIPVSGE